MDSSRTDYFSRYEWQVSFALLGLLVSFDVIVSNLGVGTASQWYVIKVFFCLFLDVCSRDNDELWKSGQSKLSRLPLDVSGVYCAWYFALAELMANTGPVDALAGLALLISFFNLFNISLEAFACYRDSEYRNIVALMFLAIKLLTFVMGVGLLLSGEWSPLIK